MKTRKIKLADLQVKSFVTSLNGKTSETVKGGTNAQSYYDLNRMGFEGSDSVAGYRVAIATNGDSIHADLYDRGLTTALPMSLMSASLTPVQ